MKKLKLGSRIAICFTLAIVLITGFLFAGIHMIMAHVLNYRSREMLSLAVSQLISQVEMWPSGLIFEDETPVGNDISWYIMEGNDSELASEGKDIALFDDIPFSNGKFSEKKLDDGEWLTLDSDVFEVGGENVRIRTAVSRAEDEKILALLRLLFVCSIPVTAAAAAIIGHLMARGFLRPVRAISECTREIEKGDLSQRVPVNGAKDEISTLAETINVMLETVEDSFKREKRFTDDASHELRTPIAVIRSYTEEALSHSEMPETERPLLNTVLQETLRMQRMTDQMLTYTRVENGKTPLCPEKFELLQIVEGVGAALEEKISEKSITLQISAEGGTDITADQTMITRLCLNLIENAVKYSGDNGHINVHIARSENVYVLTVRDDGIGISAEDLPHIFERFYRADKARDRSGTGLGLAIAKQIVDLHQGRIEVGSVPGKGSVFTVTLPVEVITVC